MTCNEVGFLTNLRVPFFDTKALGHEVVLYSF